jgi:peptide deformylase
MKPARNFDFSREDGVSLAQELTRVMLSCNAASLGANSPDEEDPVKAFVIKASPVIAAFNPRVVDYLGEELYLEESSAFYPGLIVKVKRPEGVRLRFTQPNGETVTKEYHGLTARLVLHEMHHLQGEPFYSHATKYHRDQALRRQKRKK